MIKPLFWERNIVKVTRPFTSLRGSYRVLSYINRVLLEGGMQPIRMCTMRDGSRMRLDLRSKTEWFAFYSGRYDDEYISLISNLVGLLGGGFLDVGANIGMYSVRVSLTCESPISVLCVEPVPSNVSRIKDNAAANGITALHVVEAAASNSAGVAELVLREDFEGGAETGNASIAISRNADEGFRKISIKKIRFDDLRRELQHGPYYVAKVDIEGHEDVFLEGAREWLQEERPILITEINNWFFNQRGVQSSVALSAPLPQNYKVALLSRQRGACGLQVCSFENLDHLATIENCVIFPIERWTDLQRSLA